VTGPDHGITSILYLATSLWYNHSRMKAFDQINTHEQHQPPGLNGSRDELVQKCWPRQECWDCLRHDPCSWCPSVRRTVLRIICKNPNYLCDSRELAFQIRPNFLCLLLSSTQMYAHSGRNAGRYGLLHWVATYPQLRS
jgi:hypothetical protein